MFYGADGARFALSGARIARWGAEVAPAPFSQNHDLL